MGVPGIPNSLPPQPVPPSTKYEGEIDFQLTSAGTHGPMLAPKLPVVPGSEHRPLAQPSTSSFSQNFHVADAAFSKQFSVPAQTLLPDTPSTYKPANQSAGLDQLTSEPPNYASNDYSHYPANDRGPPQHESEIWNTQGPVGSMTSSQNLQNVFIKLTLILVVFSTKLIVLIGS